MKHTPVRFSLITAALIVAAAAGAAAQAPVPEAPPRAAARAAATPDTTADEDFELDIDQRRITEQDFHAETSVEAGGAGQGGLSLGVGAVVRASEIDLLLRNVRGRVRFRASLAPLLRLFDARRGQPAAPPAPENSSP